MQEYTDIIEHNIGEKYVCFSFRTLVGDIFGWFSMLACKCVDTHVVQISQYWLQGTQQWGWSFDGAKSILASSRAL